MHRRGIVLISIVFVAIIATAVVAYKAVSRHTPEQRQSQTSTTPTDDTQPAAKQPHQTTQSKDPSYSTSDPTSIWVIVNKQRPLPATFVPSDLVTVGNGQQMRSEAAASIKRLVAAASQAGIPLTYVSGYRSYAYQQTVYSGYVKQSGQAAADTFSARPGHSEHQTGLAMDVGNSTGKCDLDICFGDTPGGQWVAANAYKYGFVIRYQANTTNITGYQYEPWHLRYVGTWLAQKLHDHPQTLEQYFGLPAATSY